MTQAQRLEALVNQIDQLYGAKVNRINRSYYVRLGGVTLLYFQTFAKGEAWLKYWIDTGRKPPLSELRVR